MNAFYFVALFVAATSEDLDTPALGWDYLWPYGPNHTCDCGQVPALGEYFESKVDCLAAYADDEYQWCLLGDVGVSVSQCASAVSTVPYVNNDGCSSLCTQLVLGSISMDDFLATCRFNFFADFEDEVATGWSSCYSNLVYGWSDYDPSSVQHAPLKVLHKVTTAQECQSLCQAVDECIFWTWRAYADREGDVAGFQNPPLTCLLYDQAYMDGVFGTVMPTSTAFATETPFCNMPAKPECLVDVFNRPYVNLLEPYECLLCDCVATCAWKSPYHLSGPAFCPEEYRDECAYTREATTTTAVPTITTGTEIVLETTAPTTVTTIALETTAPVTPVGSLLTTFTEESTPPVTVGTSTTTRIPPEETTQPAVTGGTATTVPSVCEGDCPDDCDEPEVYVDCEEPCEDCLED
eukprot:Blabericola_migrator_1__12982@NODE_862_length_6235_cov_1175_870947_g611_i0_p2_GENE_NODE_862_length_6235_cov_1175_870947_g611_i0NODE_862_length_6235_cov_1175_870947_g611_i0_p2_ORF_typecomplete_len408_score59_06PAN_4/PF14295_6/7_5e03PAN_4/PF14295_6/3_4e06PAN_4/PF14295_6/1_8e04PAN_4/PF14295_6/4_7e03PAN_1/PF00024_26/3_2e03PAN_1/PF00024_26/0_00062PAN_1/PF00024_26/1_5e04_NODE_862_length_6235_cov_1175_870947_g611_i017422965